NLIASGEAGKLIRGRCPERELRDGRSAKVTGWASEPASSQCNVRPCETRYSTTAARSHQCGQILETLKGYTAKLCKLQILTLVSSRRRISGVIRILDRNFPCVGSELIPKVPSADSLVISAGP